MLPSSGAICLRRSLLHICEMPLRAIMIVRFWLPSLDNQILLPRKRFFSDQ
jgi:hypothetical protein